MANSPSILPNLVIIGAMKSGTTSLHNYLNLHPQISMAREKELDFFIEKMNWSKGIEWYQAQFRGQAQIYGESSPNYTNYPCWQGVAQRMFSIIPDAKLIYILRDPIKRMVSEYIHQYASGIENRNYTEALGNFNNNFYLGRSRYYLQLEQYFNYFPKTNILILTAEELVSSHEKTLQTIFSFLKVEDYSLTSTYFKKLHQSKFKRRKTNLGMQLSKSSLMQTVEQFPPEIRYHAQKIIYFPFSKKIEYPNLAPELRQKITEFLREDLSCLRQYTGRNFEEWCV